MLKQIASKVQRDGLTGVAKGFKTRALSKISRELTPLIPSLIPRLYRNPTKAFIEVSGYCNLACRMCFREKRREGFMSFELFKKVIDQLADIGNVAVTLHYGGEPLLHPQFLEMLMYTMEKHKRFYNVGFFTNGMLLNELISKYLVKLQVDYTTISMDGIGAVQENIRRKSVYATVARNLNNLLGIRGSKKKPVVGINTTITTQTDDELEEIRRQWANKVDVITFSGCMNDSFFIWNMDRHLKYGGYRLPDFCDMPFREIGVLCNGKVNYCCHDIKGFGIVGDANYENLLEIWRGPKLASIRERMIHRDFSSSELCGKCMKFSFRAEVEVAKARNEEGLEVQVQTV